MSDSSSPANKPTRSLGAPRTDPLQPVIAEVVAGLLRRGQTLVPLDVLIQLEVVTEEQVTRWRDGGLPYLERGMTAGLTRVARILRLVHEHALSLGLSPTQGKYLRRGKGPRQRLRFSKRGDPDSERLYSSHFVRRAAAPEVRSTSDEEMSSKA